jgi:hypothetical protein
MSGPRFFVFQPTQIEAMRRASEEVCGTSPRGVPRPDTTAAGLKSTRSCRWERCASAASVSTNGSAARRQQPDPASANRRIPNHHTEPGRKIVLATLAGANAGRLFDGFEETQERLPIAAVPRLDKRSLDRPRAKSACFAVARRVDCAVRPTVMPARRQGLKEIAVPSTPLQSLRASAIAFPVVRAGATNRRPHGPCGVDDQPRHRRLLGYPGCRFRRKLPPARACEPHHRRKMVAVHEPLARGLRPPIKTGP